MSKQQNFNDKDDTFGSPLCLFYLSPRFSIRRKSSGSRDKTVHPPVCPGTIRHIQFNFLCSSSKRKLTTKALSAPVLASKRKYSGLLYYKRRNTGLSLEEILSTVQSVWNSPDLKSFQNSEVNDMESINHSSRKSTKEFSPVLLRRRLSAPETIIRKHVLTQERSHSQDSKTDDTSHWEPNYQSSSDSNLNKKSDSNFMRKSTLLRRFWGNTNQNSLGSFQEWQYTKKMSSSQTLHSCQSSPQRSRGSLQRLANISPKRTNPNKIFTSSIECSPKKMTMILAKSHSSDSASNNTNVNIPPLNLIPESVKSQSKSSATTKYTYSSFTSYSNNSDSAYTNSISNNSTLTNSVSTKTTINDNTNTQSAPVVEKGARYDDITNLNVISNIKLSQKTLDVIFNQIMQDVNSLTPGEVNINTATIIGNNSKKVPICKSDITNQNNFEESNSQSEKVTTPKENNQSNQDNTINHNSFFLESQSSSQEASVQNERIKQYILSNIESGSVYIKPTEHPPVVPRFSAVPRTISMEVNTSNGENDNEESDSTSFVDSLEDFNSPRTLNHDDKPVGKSTDIYDLLPDSSIRTKKPLQKSAAFFIPIEVERKKEVKAISESLPLKVRQRLNQRQQKREAKSQQIKYANSFKTVGETCHDNKNVNTPRKRSKPVLPKISLLSNKSRGERLDFKENHGRKSKSENAENSLENGTRKKGSWSKRGRNSSNEEHSEQIYSSKPTKIYQKTEIKNHKRIEILEIMECIDVSKSPRDKSKIPLPVHHRKQSFEKPSFLDAKKSPVEDLKLDQLIANILIDSLNHDLEVEKLDQDSKNANGFNSEPKSLLKQNIHEKYCNKFDVIPEEISIQSVSGEVVNNNNVSDSISFNDTNNKARNNNNVSDSISEFKDLLSSDTNKNIKFINVESPPLVMRKEESCSSIPKGWITFYTVRKDVMKTPESTSDEGKQNLSSQKKENVSLNHDSAKGKVVISEKQENLTISSSSEGTTMAQQFSLNGRTRKQSSFQRKSRQKSNGESNDKSSSGEWSVTISGSNSYGQSAPDVEMRLKFPNPNKSKGDPLNPNHSDSGLGEDNSQERNYTFPKIENNAPRISERNLRARTSFNTTNEGLPKIQTRDKRNKKRESSLMSSSAMANSSIIPRQNKASTCRYQFSRPREMYCLPDVSSRIAERHYTDLLRRFPDLLAVSGRSISPERKIMDRDYYD